MSEIPDGVVHTCVTSPPYFGLRDYGIDGQIGMEDSLDEYTGRLLRVFREVWRVLREDGIAWLNLGDSYYGDSPIRKASQESFSATWDPSLSRGNGGNRRTAARSGVFKTKDLMLVPHRVAIALHADGWYVRDAVIWHKPNPMPSSATDRCTPAYEPVFMLTKQPKYFADMDAVREPLAEGSENKTPGRNSRLFVDRDPAHTSEAEAARKAARRGKTWEERKAEGAPMRHGTAGAKAFGESDFATNPQGSNLRNVWSIAPEGYDGAHFAVMPRELVRRCVLIGSPAGGLVLDPFMGSGTVADVAIGCGRNYVGYELNPDFCTLIQDRLGLFGEGVA